MALPASDNFNRSNETLQTSSNWTFSFRSASADLAIVSNQLKCDTNAQWACCYWSADSFDASHWSQLTVNGDSASGGPAVRITGGDCYYLDNFGSNIQIYHFNGGSFDSIDSIVDDYIASSVYKLEANDEGGGVTRLIAYEDGTEMPGLNNTDSNLSGGFAGVFIFDDELILDDWGGDDVSGIIDASGNIDLPVLAINGLSAIALDGAGAITFSGVTLSGNSDIEYAGIGILNLAGIEISGIAGVEHIADGAFSLPAISIEGVAGASLAGNAIGDVQLSMVSFNGVALITHDASGNILSPNLIIGGDVNGGGVEALFSKPFTSDFSTTFTIH